MILITGGSGFIGSHLVEALCARGEAVRCLIRRECPLPGGVEAARGDLVSGVGVEQALQGVDTVMHLAGVTKALSIEDYYAGNVRATENLAKAMLKAGREIRLVHVGSLASIGPSVGGHPVSEDDEPHPLTHYGKSKLEGERTARTLIPHCVVVRPPVAYGPRDTDVFELLKSISRGLAVEIAGGERWAQVIYVKDLVDGMLLARRPEGSGRSYFLAHPKAVSWGELRDVAARIMHKRPRVLTIPAALAFGVGACAEILAKLTRKPGIISREKVKEALAHAWTCQTQRARQELGFEARTPLETGLAETLAWYKEAGWLEY